MKNKEQVEADKKYVEAKIPKTKPFPTLLWAFLIGGAICCIGQGVNDGITALFPNLTKDLVASYTQIFMVFLGTLFTGIGIYDKLGSFAGAGSVIPITGFANSVASPAIEFKTEGWIFGMCVKMFSIAGPVIVNGVAASMIVGFIYLFV